MNLKNQIIISALSAVLFTALFYKQLIGLNLIIFEMLFFIQLLITRQYKFIGKNQLVFGFAFILTSLITFTTHTSFSLVMNLIASIAFIGVLIYPEAKSIVNVFKLSITSLFTSQYSFLNGVFSSRVFGVKISRSVNRLGIFVLPVMIILLFIFLYSSSNPVFNNIFTDIAKSIQESIKVIFSNINSILLLTLLLGLVISNYAYIRIGTKNIIKNDLKSNDKLLRIRKKRLSAFKSTSLKREYRAGVFLVFVLNILLLILNVIDINTVWINFEWTGHYLKQFVHEGTYLLIVSIIVSIVIVLYFFRGNINFYQKNRSLKYLSYVWLIQNVILAISVAVRNYRYIEYFALAYKRIGVIIFLVLVIIGLITVFIKLHKRKSTFYLLRSNVLAIFVVLIISSAFPWDIIVAKYNFRNAERSFLHLDYLSTLPDKCLPYLDKPLSELKRIEAIQKENFPFYQEYMTAEEYYYTIQKRKEEFKVRWESSSILSLNLPDHLSYNKLVK